MKATEGSGSISLPPSPEETRGGKAAALRGEEQPLRGGSPLHYADCEDVLTCIRCHEAKDRRKRSSLLQEPFLEGIFGKGMRPARSFGSLPFFRDRSGSLQKAKPKKERAGSTILSGRSFRVSSSHSSPSSSPSSASKFFIATPMVCVPLGAYVAAAHKDDYLSRTLSLRQEKKRFSIRAGSKVAEDVGASGPPAARVFGSRSLETLVVSSLWAGRAVHFSEA